MQGAKNLVSTRSLLDLLKSMFKLVLIAVITIASIRGALASLIEMPACGLGGAGSVLGASLRMLIGGSAVVTLVFGIFDLFIQRWPFMREQRMSHTEMKNERKESDGNPEIRKAHARERREAANLRVGLHEATFIIAGGNFAVAMRFSKVDTKVPIPVARAEAESVHGLLQEARRRKLPIASDGSTARRVFEKIQLGQRISRELYEPVLRCMNELGV
jgi:type III secretion protein U